MAKAKTPSTPNKKPPSEGELAAAADPDATPTVLSAEDSNFLERVTTLLLHIPTYASRAALHGYDQEEHDLGRSLLDKASGRNRPLSHWFAERDQAAEPALVASEQMRLLQEIDAFENKWFPRFDKMITRMIPEANRDRFREVFFKDLSQQPLGPGVVDSVETLLNRYGEVEQSKEPGANPLVALARKRGLTPDKVAEVRGLIAAARKGLKSTPVQIPVSADELAKGKAEQIEALGELKAWYADWSTTFRQVFSRRICIRLGISSLRRTSGGDDEGEDGGDDGATGGAEGGETP